MRLVIHLARYNVATPPGKSSLVVGDMRSLEVDCFGGIQLVVHCAQGDVQIRVLDVAYVPGVQLNIFPAARSRVDAQKMLNAEGDAVPYVIATRIVDALIPASIFPGEGEEDRH